MVLCAPVFKLIIWELPRVARFLLRVLLVINASPNIGLFFLCVPGNNRLLYSAVVDCSKRAVSPYEYSMVVADFLVD